MQQARAAASQEGCPVHFPFKATDVETVYTSFHKLGRGVYFRLRDGRVFSAFGAELDPNPALYGGDPPRPTLLSSGFLS